MALYSSDFSRVFSNLLERYHVSCYQIEEYSQLNQSYLSRLRSGQMNNPSPETIVKIAISLTHCNRNITLIDIENLFNACGRSLQKTKAPAGSSYPAFPSQFSFS
jgi:transcriptional regulator with XRE-family HTH domain